MNNQNKPTILIVEDEETLLKALAIKFVDQGFKTFEALDGEKALEIVKETKPDIILLDIILPKKDGITVLSELKSNPETKDIPVLLLTNLADHESISKGVEIGARGYLVKADLSLDEVIKKVKEILKI